VELRHVAAQQRLGEIMYGFYQDRNTMTIKPLEERVVITVCEDRAHGMYCWRVLINGVLHNTHMSDAYAMDSAAKWQRKIGGKIVIKKVAPKTWAPINL
jgi:hypothetical protein